MAKEEWVSRRGIPSIVLELQPGEVRARAVSSQQLGKQIDTTEGDDMALAKGAVERALQVHGGNITAAGKALGVSERAVRYAIDKHDIDIDVIRAVGPTTFADGEQVVTREKVVVKEVPPADYVALETKVRRLEDKASRRERDWKEMTRQADLAQRLSDAVAPHMERIQLPSVKAPKLAPGDKSPITLQQVISDVHWGKVFHAPMINGLNAYGPEIAARRMQHVVDVVGAWKENYEAQGRPVERLVLPLIGDNFNGNLHPEDEDNYADTLIQCIDVSLVLAQMIAEMAHWFPRIDIVAPAGDNHTRLTKKSATSAKAFGTTLNTMMLTNISLLLRGIKHVHVHMDISHQTYYNIYGRTWGACHGNMLKGGGGSLGIPAYGMRRHHDGSIAETVILAKRQARELQFAESTPMEERLQQMYGLLEGIVDYSLVGHFHTRQVLEFTTGALFLMPSAMGPDPYARDALRKPGSMARQMLFAIHPKLDIIGEHEIRLNQFMSHDEKSRYDWGVLERGGDAAAIMDEWEAKQ